MHVLYSYQKKSTKESQVSASGGGKNMGEKTGRLQFFTKYFVGLQLFNIVTPNLMNEFCSYA